MRKVRFCWLCGNKLQGNYFDEREVDKHLRIMHKRCAELVDAGDEDAILEHMESVEAARNMRRELWHVP